MNRITLLALLISFVSIANNQTLTVKGQVKNKLTGYSVPEVSIIIKSTGVQTISDENGFFEISVLNSDKSVLVFNHIGFSDLEVELSELNRDEFLIVQMTPLSQDLSEIEILGERNNVRPYVIENIDSKQLKSTNLSDLGAIISQEPNVGGIKKGATGIDPVVRGFKYSQVMVQLNNGTRIEGGCPNRMDPTAAHVNVNEISDISIIKGPFALKYGTSFGGLIILETFKPSFYNKFENHISLMAGGQTNHEGFRSGLRINGGDSKFSYTFSAAGNKYGDYKAGNGDIINSASESNNVKGGIGFRINKKNTITIEADKSWAKNIDFPTLPMDERSDNTRVYELNYSGSGFNNRIDNVKVSAYHSDVEHEMDNKNRPFSDTVVAISKISATNTGGKLAVNFSGLKGTIEAGTNFEHIYKDGNRYKYLIAQPGLPSLTENLWNDARIDNLGVYAEYQKTGIKTDWVIAFRTDFNSATSGPMLRLKKNGNVVYENTDTDSRYFNFSVSGGIIWKLNEKSNLNISLGKGTRSPDMTERFIILLPVGYDPYDYLGNPKLKPETNYELDLSFKRNCYRSGRFEFSVFFSYVSDYISAVLVPPSVLKPQTKGVLGVKNFININNAYFTGYEFKYTTPDRNNWQLMLSSAYTMGTNLSAIKYIYEDGEVIDEAEIKNDPLPEIPPLEGSIGFRYKMFNNKLIPAISIRLVSGQNRISEAYNEQSTPGFALCNFKLEYRYNNNLNVNFGINNIFDNLYYEHLNRRITGTRSPYYEPGRLFYTNLIVNL